MPAKAPGPQPSEVAPILEALAEARPDTRGVAPELLGAGLDHAAYRVGDLVLRVRRGPGADLRREAELLRLVARRSAVPTPLPAAAGASWIAYPALPGVPLLRHPPEFRAAHAQSVARSLASLLAALWSTPATELTGLVGEDATPLEEWREGAARLARELTGALPGDDRAGVERFLASPLPPPAARRVFSHNDLGAEHVLLDPETSEVTGIVDWSDAAIVDPAKDLGLILRDLGPAALEIALEVATLDLGAPDHLRRRARFYARCLALEDLAYGIERDDAAYVTSARTAIASLFRWAATPPGPG